MTILVEGGLGHSSQQAAAHCDQEMGSRIRFSVPGWSDWAGMTASIGCAIHCAAMPFVISYLPALGLSFLADETFHQWMAVACFAIATTAFIPGLRRHGRYIPVLIGGFGLTMISVAAFGFAGDCCASCSSEETAGLAAKEEASADTCCPLCAKGGTPTSANEDENLAVASGSVADERLVASVQPFLPWLTPLGGLILVSAHLLNHRYGCLCGCCESVKD